MIIAINSRTIPKPKWVICLWLMRHLLPVLMAGMAATISAN
ncbi:MAG: hypothetical protein WB870_16780 [Gallionellaceae bacterium]